MMLCATARICCCPPLSREAGWRRRVGQLGEEGVDAIELAPVAVGMPGVGAEEQIVLDREAW